jgi:tetratricopeptide (TPR) repeat protein
MPARQLLAIASLACLLSILPLGAAAGQDGGDFAEGERLFREDKAQAAALALEKAVTQAGVDERAWLYLGACYEELGRYDEAVNVLRKGASQALRFKHLFLYNMANNFVLQGKNSFAEEMYGQALSANPSYAPALLNRANVRIALRDYAGASSDYGSYLNLEPASPQRPAIEALLAKLNSDLSAQAAQAAAEEEAKKVAEAAHQALMASVTASLKAAAEETTSLSAGSGAVQGYGDDLVLDQ